MPDYEKSPLVKPSRYESVKSIQTLSIIKEIYGTVMPPNIKEALCSDQK